MSSGRITNAPPVGTLEDGQYRARIFREESDVPNWLRSFYSDWVVVERQSDGKWRRVFVGHRSDVPVLVPLLTAVGRFKEPPAEWCPDDI